jgi:hypothetical protein
VRDPPSNRRSLSEGTKRVILGQANKKRSQHAAPLEPGGMSIAVRGGHMKITEGFSTKERDCRDDGVRRWRLDMVNQNTAGQSANLTGNRLRRAKKNH